MGAITKSRLYIEYQRGREKGTKAVFEIIITCDFTQTNVKLKEYQQDKYNNRRVNPPGDIEK
jgi:hypothetical protein